MRSLYDAGVSRRSPDAVMALSTASLLLIVLFPTVLWSGEEKLETPTEAVRMTLTEVFRILEDPKLKDPSQQGQRRHLLEATIARRFDYEEMSKRTLGAHWGRLTDEQRGEFVDAFRGFLSDRYAGKIEGYSGEKIHYLSERLEGAYAEVRTKLVSSKVEYPMDYRLINKAGRWFAYDIIADGVSLVRNYRSQFEKILKTGSFEELVSRLKEHGHPRLSSLTPQEETLSDS